MSRLIWTIVALTACGAGPDGPTLDDGELNGHCYPNGTCNVGLSCSAGTCLPSDASIDSMPDAAVCANDSAYEPNDTISQAYVTGVADSSSTRTMTGLSLCPSGDVDHYAISIDEPNTNIEMIVQYAESGAALEASVLNSGGVAIANATLQSSPARTLRAFVPNVPAGIYYAQVRSASGYNDYQLTVSDGECVNAVTPAAPKHAHADGTGSKRGTACMASGCHLAGGGGPTFTFSGTVSTAADGNTPKPGATVKVEFGTTTIAAVADEDGNFYSTQTITLPAKTLATSCPTVAPMVGMIVTGGGNCNNCHINGGTTTPIYVP